MLCSGPTVAPRNHSPKGYPNIYFVRENAQTEILVLRAFEGPRGPARMRETLEMVTASKYVANLSEKRLFRDQLTLLDFLKKSFWGSRR